MNVRAHPDLVEFCSNLHYTDCLVGDYIDAGQAFYSTDFWSIWDIGIVLTGVVFFVTSKSTKLDVYSQSGATDHIHRNGGLSQRLGRSYWDRVRYPGSGSSFSCS